MYAYIQIKSILIQSVQCRDISVRVYVGKDSGVRLQADHNRLMDTNRYDMYRLKDLQTN